MFTIGVILYGLAKWRTMNFTKWIIVACCAFVFDLAFLTLVFLK